MYATRCSSVTRFDCLKTVGTGCFIPTLFRFFNFSYCSYISYADDSLFYFNFWFLSFTYLFLLHDRSKVL